MEKYQLEGGSIPYFPISPGMHLFTRNYKQVSQESKNLIFFGNPLGNYSCYYYVFNP